VRVPGAVWSSFDGYFGNLPVSASVHVKGDQVDANIDVPRGLPEDVQALLAEWPLRQAVSGHVEATGTLPVLQANARFDLDASRITASAPSHSAGTSASSSTSRVARSTFARSGPRRR